MAKPDLASAAWTEGEPLNAGKLLYTPDGRPRLSIISTAHLSDAERMFLVTVLLNEVISWMRTQPGSRTLRALLYMDEIFGYFPPTANPPSKIPMLTLLKQARAFGLGVVLATQNPVDLDYKGLSNCGTWFLGRLQTERDKARVMEGLEGASAAAGASFNRAEMEKTLAGLGNRVFLMNNVHEDEPVLFQTRWVLSYLSGPMTREQIGRLNQATPSAVPVQTPVREPAPPVAASASGTGQSAEAEKGERPLPPADVIERFIPLARPGRSMDRLLYRPALLGLATLRYANARANVDEWQKVALLAKLREGDSGIPWEEATESPLDCDDLDPEPHPTGQFAELPAEALNPKSYSRWEKC